MPQFLRERYDERVSTIMAVFWLLLYVFVNLTSIIYLGALSLQNMLNQHSNIAQSGCRYLRLLSLSAVCALSAILMSSRCSF